MKRAGIAATFALTLAAVLATAGTTAAETVFQATLDESQNVPPTGSGATGTATLVLNNEQTEVSYVVTYTGLEGTETGAHFHQGPPGENGSILYPLPAGTPKFGIWAVTAHDVGDLFAGRVYVNIHTDLYPGGEIRGDISESATGVAAEPADTSWSRIKMLYR